MSLLPSPGENPPYGILEGEGETRSSLEPAGRPFPTRLLTVSDPGLFFPESACRWPQVFHTQGIRLRPMTLFNPVFSCQTPPGRVKRLKTQADEGLGPQPEAGDSSRRSWLCLSASAPSQQACEPVQDRCSGPCSRPRHAAAWRSRHRAPAGWVAVEATSRPRQFGYETPQLRLERRLHAGSPYRSNDLVSAGPEPPLSCDLRLNHARTRPTARVFVTA